jgi:hypothetical protein
VRARLTVVVVALFLSVVSAGVTVAAASAGGRVYVRTAIVGGGLAVKPEEIALSVHGSLSLHKLGWASWGGAVAKATARARVRGCVPDCNLGGLKWPRARVRLSDRVRCEGRLVYGRLGYALGGEIPAGVERRGRVDMLPRGC